MPVDPFSEELVQLYGKAVTRGLLRTMHALEFAMDQLGRDLNADYAKSRDNYIFQRLH